MLISSCLIVQVRKTRYQMHKAIDPDYYGFRDEEDGVLEPLEAEAEKNMRAQVGGCW
jgi:pre-mRNA-splicing factor ISY1